MTQQRISSFAVIWSVARTELACALRTRALVVLGAMIALLLVIACVLGYQRHERQSDQRAAFQALVRQQWVDQPDRHPHRVAHYGSFAFRPTGALGFFDPGIDAYAGTMVYLEAHRRNSASFSEASQESGLMRMGNASPAFVLQVLVPLLIFCLAFRAIAGEREAGTWPLALAQGASPRLLVIGKILGTLLTVGIVLAPFALVAVAVLAATSALGALLVHVLLLVAAYTVYLGACAAVAVVVSFWHQRSHAALVSLLGIWIALWIVIPRVVTSAAEMVYPAPLRAELEMAISRALRTVGDSHNPEDPYFARLKQQYLERYGVDRVEDLPINFGGVVMREAEAITSKVQDEHYGRVHAIHDQQDQLTLTAGLLTPLLAVRSLSMALAGTDSHHAADFHRQAEAHRYAFIQSLNDMHTHEIRWKNDRAQRIDRSRWAQFPEFSYQPPPLGWAMAPVRAATGGLILWGLLALLLVWIVPAHTRNQP